MGELGFRLRCDFGIIHGAVTSLSCLFFQIGILPKNGGRLPRFFRLPIQPCQKMGKLQVLTGLTRLSAGPNPVYKPSALLRRGEEFCGVANLAPLERSREGKGESSGARGEGTHRLDRFRLPELAVVGGGV